MTSSELVPNLLHNQLQTCNMTSSELVPNLLHNQFQTCFRQMVCQLRAKERAIFAIQQQNEGNLDAQHEVSARSSIRFIFKGSFL